VMSVLSGSDHRSVEDDLRVAHRRATLVSAAEEALTPARRHTSREGETTRGKRRCLVLLWLLFIQGGPQKASH